MECFRMSTLLTYPMTLKITQAAREAATDLIECLAGGKTASSVKMRIAAADDYPEVQAFQRAMNQAADEALEAAAKVAERFPMRSDYTKHDTMNGIAAAIRALKGQQP